MTVEIVYETHSISEHNEEGIASGWLPGELSERGLALAVELGERRGVQFLSAPGWTFHLPSGWAGPV